jgi:DNA repair exonuclease SbcCD ATPase subunit
MTKIRNKESDLNELRAQVKTEQKNIKSFEKMIEEQNTKIEEIGRKSVTLKESMEKFNTIRDYINAIKTLLKDENIKQHVIKRIMPYLNKQANYYLSEVDYSFYIKIDKWLDIEVKGPGITNATYDSLSGGERRGIDLAIQLGFLDIARTQAGIFPDLLTFDELLDSSIDAQGIGEVLKITRVKQREANGKFFIISHRSEIDNELIDNRYHVVKENGYSRVEI